MIEFLLVCGVLHVLLFGGVVNFRFYLREHRNRAYSNILDERGLYAVFFVYVDTETTILVQRAGNACLDLK